MDIQELKKLEGILGHTFTNTDILERALTHSSSNTKSYERLEFLGDRVLGLVMAELLFNTFPDEAEGDLAKRHTALVNGETLANIANEINLNPFIRLSDAERAAGGAENTHILADIMESLIATIYLDSSLENTATILKTLLGNRLTTMKAPPQDAKTALQEWAQARALDLPDYTVIDRDGPDHAPNFTVELTIKGLTPVQSTATSKRLAEKKAAQEMLTQITQTQK